MISSAYSPASKQESFLDTFNLFPDFPIELRRSIWKFAAGPRVVEIIYNQFTGCYESTTAIPAILHTTQESREVALECYDLCFSTDDAEPTIYFDFSIDALYLGVGSLAPIRYPFQQFLKSVNRQDLSRVRSLFLEDKYEVEFAKEGNVLKLPPYGFDGLQELTIVVGNGPTKKEDWDVVLAGVEGSIGELQAWLVKKSGAIEPWHLPRGRWPEICKAQISYFWAHFEKNEHPEDSQLKLTRIVSRRRLYHEPRLQDRMKFLRNHTFLVRSCCFWKNGGITARVEELHRIRAVYRKVKERLGYSPRRVAQCLELCACRNRHQKRGSTYSEDEVAPLNLEEDLYWLSR